MSISESDHLRTLLDPWPEWFRAVFVPNKDFGIKVIEFNREILNKTLEYLFCRELKVDFGAMRGLCLSAAALSSPNKSWLKSQTTDELYIDSCSDKAALNSASDSDNHKHHRIIISIYCDFRHAPHKWRKSVLDRCDFSKECVLKMINSTRTTRRWSWCLKYRCSSLWPTTHKSPRAPFPPDLTTTELWLIAFKWARTYGHITHVRVFSQSLVFLCKDYQSFTAGISRCSLRRTHITLSPLKFI